MKNKATQIFIIVIMMVFTVGCGQQSTKKETSEEKSITKEQLAEGIIVEAACGECQFELPGNGCDLAVRINGTAYFVDGVNMDDHGDAHAENGLCNAVREAKVMGQIVEGRFIAKSFELIAEHKHDHDANNNEHEGHDHDADNDEHEGHDRDADNNELEGHDHDGDDHDGHGH